MGLWATSHAEKAKQKMPCSTHRSKRLMPDLLPTATRALVVLINGMGQSIAIHAVEGAGTRFVFVPLEKVLSTLSTLS